MILFPASCLYCSVNHHISCLFWSWFSCFSNCFTPSILYCHHCSLANGYIPSSSISYNSNSFTLRAPQHIQVSQISRAQCHKPPFSCYPSPIIQPVSTIIVDLASDLPSNEDTTMYLTCKNAATISHYHDRTDGIMAIACPCGIMIDWREMYASESSRQLFVQLLKVIIDEGSNVRFVGFIEEF